MSKILSQAGNSLADIYDVEGSIAGIDQLETRELPIVHEMGGTVFSERLSGRIFRFTSGAIAQSIAFNVVGQAFAPTPVRILGVFCFASVGSRLNEVTVSLRETIPSAEQEIPIFAWDLNEGTVISRIMDVAAVATVVGLSNSAAIASQNLPTLLLGSGQPQPVQEIAFRGIATAFGAGTVTVTCLIYVAFPQLEGLSSRGLPLPGW